MNCPTFLYFAYGSNLLKKRIHINNPSAKFIGIGRLNNHRLDFIKRSNRWNGASATIIPKKDLHVWGAIWELDICDMPHLDVQEGVDTNWYFAKMVEINKPDGSQVQCRVYQQTILPSDDKDLDDLPPDRQPSKTYMQCIIDGATECNIPSEYIISLKHVLHNGKDASPEMIESLRK